MTWTTLFIITLCFPSLFQGLNNNFQINSGSELALLYNDQSVLENHHASTGLSKLARSKLLAPFEPSTVKQLRSTVIALVLATDMSQHWKVRHLAITTFAYFFPRL